MASQHTTTELGYCLGANCCCKFHTTTHSVKALTITLFVYTIALLLQLYSAAERRVNVGVLAVLIEQGVGVGTLERWNVGTAHTCRRELSSPETRMPVDVDTCVCISYSAAATAL